MVVGVVTDQAYDSSWSGRTISHTGIEKGPDFLKAAVGNIGQWAKA